MRGPTAAGKIVRCGASILALVPRCLQLPNINRMSSVTITFLVKFCLQFRLFSW